MRMYETNEKFLSQFRSILPNEQTRKELHPKRYITIAPLSKCKLG